MHIIIGQGYAMHVIIRQGYAMPIIIGQDYAMHNTIDRAMQCILLLDKDMVYSAPTVRWTRMWCTARRL